MSRWADKQKISYTTYSNLCQKPEVYELIEKEIKAVNDGLQQGCRIKIFVNFYKEFDPDELELTRSRKLRRNYLEEKYRDLVNAIYEGKTSIDMEIQIRYQDARTGSIKTSLKIQELKE
jgi:long-chain acyl-CoA synthetase